MSTAARIPNIVNRDHLNPRFDGYKLRDWSAAISSVRSGALPVHVSWRIQSNLPHRRMEFRARYNHLFVDPYHPDVAFYVDSAFNVVMIKAPIVNENSSGAVESKIVFTIPDPRTRLESINRGDDDSLEHPSLVFLSPDVIIVCDGASRCYLLNLKPQVMSMLGVGDISDAVSDEVKDGEWSHYTLLASSASQSSECLVLALRSRTETVDSSASYTKRRTLFHLDLLRLSVSDGRIVTERLTSAKSTTAPHFAHFHPSRDSFIVASEEPYEPAVTRPQIAASPSAAGVEQQHEPGRSAPAQPPYMWTQTNSDVTVQIPLAAPTDGRSIRSVIERQRIKVQRVESDGMSLTTVFEGATFADVVPTDSLWTLEDRRFISLHLQKLHEGTRWTHVLDTDDGVLETLDPSELAIARERLEKYTADAVGDMEGGIRRPDNLQYGFEVEEDEDFAGCRVHFGRFAVDGGLVLDQVSGGGHEWICEGFGVGSSGNDSGVRTVCLKSDVDGLLVRIGSNLELTHEGTFDAFHFVQSSKRDKRFVRFTSDMRYAIVVEAKKRMYIYKRTPGANQCDQYVVDVDQVTFEGQAQARVPDDGMVVGIQELGNGCILLLTEKRVYQVLWSQ